MSNASFFFAFSLLVVSFKTDLFREEELLLDKKKGLSITKQKEKLTPYLSLILRNVRNYGKVR